MHNHVGRHGHFPHDTFKVCILTQRLKLKNLAIFIFCTAQFQIQLNNWFQSRITDTNEQFDMKVWICAKKVMIVDSGHQRGIMKEDTTNIATYSCWQKSFDKCLKQYKNTPFSFLYWEPLSWLSNVSSCQNFA